VPPQIQKLHPNFVFQQEAVPPHWSRCGKRNAHIFRICDSNQNKDMVIHLQVITV